MKVFIVTLIWLIYVWGVGYFFHLFPWSNQDFGWWYVPQIFTVIAFGIPFTLLTNKVLDV